MLSRPQPLLDVRLLQHLVNPLVAQTMQLLAGKGASVCEVTSFLRREGTAKHGFSDERPET